jgi:hypothetical protein
MSLREELEKITEEVKEMANKYPKEVNFFGVHGAQQINEFQEIEGRIFQIIDKYRQKHLSELSEDDKEVLIMSGYYERSREDIINTGDAALLKGIRKIFENQFGDYSGISNAEISLIEKLKKRGLPSIQTELEVMSEIHSEIAVSDMSYLNAILFDVTALYLYSYREQVKQILERGLIVKLDSIITETFLSYKKHDIHLTFKLSDNIKQEIVNLIKKRFFILAQEERYLEANDLIYTTNLTVESFDQAHSFFEKILNISQETSEARDGFFAVLKDKLFLLSHNEFIQKMRKISNGELQEKLDAQERKLYLALFKRVEEAENNLFDPFAKKELKMAVIPELKLLGDALDIFE